MIFLLVGFEGNDDGALVLFTNFMLACCCVFSLGFDGIVASRTSKCVLFNEGFYGV